jgi:hypothetical protein
LTDFEPGNYRLEIKLTDKGSSKTLTGVDQVRRRLVTQFSGASSPRFERFMAGATSVLASAAVGGLLVVELRRSLCAAECGAGLVSCCTHGLVCRARLHRGRRARRTRPSVPNVVVSALGAVTTVATRTPPDSFSSAPSPLGLPRSGASGRYTAPRAQMVQVRPSARAVSAIALRREALPVLAAGVGLSGLTETEATTSSQPTAVRAPPGARRRAHRQRRPLETAWRIRHGRRVAC